ncbi:hypothetical protein BC832DRAFT_616358 [Gaertneriomyces semiglobifer]|nr:hypothetical protein BC832DRAFT_616358 [Gaertneriomyces semiglobifer]
MDTEIKRWEQLSLHPYTKFHPVLLPRPKHRNRRTRSRTRELYHQQHLHLNKPKVGESVKQLLDRVWEEQRQDVEGVVRRGRAMRVWKFGGESGSSPSRGGDNPRNERRRSRSGNAREDGTSMNVNSGHMRSTDDGGKINVEGTNEIERRDGENVGERGIDEITGMSESDPDAIYDHTRLSKPATTPALHQLLEAYDVVHAHPTSRLVKPTSYVVSVHSPPLLGTITDTKSTTVPRLPSIAHSALSNTLTLNPTDTSRPQRFITPTTPTASGHKVDMQQINRIINPPKGLKHTRSHPEQPATAMAVERPTIMSDLALEIQTYIQAELEIMNTKPEAKAPQQQKQTLAMDIAHRLARLSVYSDALSHVITHCSPPLSTILTDIQTLYFRFIDQHTSTISELPSLRQTLRHLVHDDKRVLLKFEERKVAKLQEKVQEVEDLNQVLKEGVKGKVSTYRQFWPKRDGEEVRPEASREATAVSSENVAKQITDMEGEGKADDVGVEERSIHDDAINEDPETDDPHTTEPDVSSPLKSPSAPSSPISPLDVTNLNQQLTQLTLENQRLEAEIARERDRLNELMRDREEYGLGQLNEDEQEDDEQEQEEDED